MRLINRAIALAALGASLFAAASDAAVVSTPVFVQTPRAYKAQIVNASGTSPVTLVAGGANGTKVSAIIVTNTDTSAYTVTLSVVRTAVTYVITTVSVPLSSGNTTAAAPYQLLSLSNIPGLPVDSDGNPYFYLESTDTLQVASGGTVTSAKALSFLTVAADF